MTGAELEFRFGTPADETRFVREYLVDAWDRFEASDHFDTGWFWRYGQFADLDAGFDGGRVTVVFEGDPDALVAAERDRWAAFDDLSWTAERYDEYDSLLAQQRDARGPAHGEWEYRVKPLVARFALDVVAAFDRRLPPTAGPLLDDVPSYGFWATLHYVLVATGYDWFEEIDVLLTAVESRLQVMSVHYGDTERAQSEVADCVDRLASFADDLDAWAAAELG